ncbi:MAG: hypothetical protein OEU84_00125 [Xanthomonadales bacterium]|nr:hypothetical protein [Xanthomonadales bacterium]MDH4017981.1 hypothetical protein [Xanthomonadales bacterium]
MNSTRLLRLTRSFGRIVMMLCLVMVLPVTVNAMAEQTGSVAQSAEVTTNRTPQGSEEISDITEEVNTNDPTAAAISVSFGWEFFDWHEDEISPGVTRPPGNDNNFNSRIVMPLPAGTLGSPWPIINRFSFANVEAPGGTSGSGNAEFISLFIPKTWATGKIGIGPALNLPADDKQFGANVWRYGFAGVALENSFEGRLMWGVLIRQVWGKTDPNSNKVLASPFALQPIAVYQLSDGWYLSNGESAIAYNWQKNEWLVPLGIRLGKTIKDRKGGTWNMYGEYRTNVVYKDWPGAAAKNIFRISASYTFAN